MAGVVKWLTHQIVALACVGSIPITRLFLILGYSQVVRQGTLTPSFAKALQEPLKQIAINAGLEGAVIVENVKTSSANEGFDALNEKYVDMIKAGIIDPTKVTRSALQNAASIAAILLTTEAVIEIGRASCRERV